MKRSWIVPAAVVVAIAVAVVALVARRGGHTAAPPQPGVATIAARVFSDDSLGIRLRIPESPGWTLQRDLDVRPDGRVVTANHSSDLASARVFVLPATPDTNVEGLLEGRKKEIATVFGVQDLEKAVAGTVRNEKKDINGHAFRQWQAVTQPVTAPGEKSSRIVFLWLGTVASGHSLECLGIVRYHEPPTPEEQQSTDALLRDLSYIMQSFEVR
jgi:hypothetical protein